jgi:chlorophyll synthase
MLFIGQNTYALIVAALVIPQFLLQFSLIRSPKTMDVRYNAIAQNFLVAGMLVCALAIKAAKP